MNPDRSTTIDVDGHEVSLTNLDRVLYPATGFTKGEVVSYYRGIAPVILGHIADRPLTLKRFPDGVDHSSFYEKHAPKGRPGWVRTAEVTIGDGVTVEYVLAGDLATLMWTSNLGAIELHTPMWRHPAIGKPDMIVFDLDPGAPATIVECCVVAGLLRDVLAAAGLTPVTKTSGSKGLHVLAGIEDMTSDESTEFAHTVARHLEHEAPDLVVSRMTKSIRNGKVLVDWSQNRAAKSTVAPYSLRGRPEPRVSTPITWNEVADCERPDDLVFGPAEVLERVAAIGDLCAVLDDARAKPAALPAG